MPTFDPVALRGAPMTEIRIPDLPVAFEVGQPLNEQDQEEAARRIPDLPAANAYLSRELSRWRDSLHAEKRRGRDGAMQAEWVGWLESTLEGEDEGEILRIAQSLIIENGWASMEGCGPALPGVRPAFEAWRDSRGGVVQLPEKWTVGIGWAIDGRAVLSIRSPRVEVPRGNGGTSIRGLVSAVEGIGSDASAWAAVDFEALIAEAREMTYMGKPTVQEAEFAAARQRTRRILREWCRGRPVRDHDFASLAEAVDLYLGWVKDGVGLRGRDLEQIDRLRASLDGGGRARLAADLWGADHPLLGDRAGFESWWRGLQAPTS